MTKVLFEHTLNNRVFRVRDDGRQYVVTDNGRETLWGLASSLEMLMAREIERLRQDRQALLDTTKDKTKIVEGLAAEIRRLQYYEQAIVASLRGSGHDPEWTDPVSWLDELQAKIERLQAIVDPINQLLQVNGDAVTIFYDNPESDGSASGVITSGSWCGFADQRYVGGTLAEALATALKDREECEAARAAGGE